MRVIVLIGLGLMVGACEREPAPSAPGPASTQRVVEHLRAAGEELKAAATEAATQVKPALDRAAEEAREAAHRVGEKIENATSQPGTGPAIQAR